jgi:hypothetical protein
MGLENVVPLHCLSKIAGAARGERWCTFKRTTVLTFQNQLTKPMSKIKLEAPFRQFRGKICKHSDIIYKQMHGETFTSQICNPYKGEPSAAQVAQKERFRQAKANVAQLTQEQWQEYKTAFAKKPGKYKTIQGYVLAKEMAKIGN